MSNNLDLIRSRINSYSGPRNSQFKQDIVAMAVNDFSYNRFFVEFGAMTGVAHSNTLLLEKQYHWRGILFEPGKGFHEELFTSRSAIIDTRAVTDKTGDMVEFKELLTNSGLSGLEKYNYNDLHATLRKITDSRVYTVETVSLTDLLDQYKAPQLIDYMSVDTEGSEPDILDAFDFSKYVFRFINVEHNYNEESKQRVRKRLHSFGYRTVFEDISGIDDYFMNLAFI
jgi:FkbM family methyltransferase